jgi:hypothetical protein
MDPAAPGAPGTGSTAAPGRRSRGGAVTAAVVLALLTMLGIAGPVAGTVGERAGSAGRQVGDTGPQVAGTGQLTGATAPLTGGGPAPSGHSQDDGPRADDRCDAACVVRATTRQEPYSEHPAPRGHLVMYGQDDGVAHPRHRAEPPAPTVHPLSAQPLPTHDRGRAPPVISGT